METTEKEVSLCGVTLHYQEGGETTGHPIIIMHGWGCDHTTIDSVAAVARAGGMHVYNLDLPGHGKSSEPSEVWGVGDYTRLVEEFISHHNLNRPVLVGHSFGGRIAIMLASKIETGKIVLVDAAGIKPRRSAAYYVKVYSFKLAKKLLPVIFGRKRGQIMIDSWRGKAGSADYRNSSPVMRAVMSRCVNEDLKRFMPGITAPTLLIWGKNDTATPLSDAKTMERLIPDAGLVAFDGCGHYSFLDNPAGFRAVFKSFLSDEMTKHA